MSVTEIAQIEIKPNGRDRMLVIFSEEMSKSFKARYPDIIAIVEVLQSSRAAAEKLLWILLILLLPLIGVLIYFLIGRK